MKKLTLVLQCIFEVFAVLLFPFTIILGILKFFLPLERINLDNTKKIPIVIHEHWLNKNYWHFFMKRYLENKGYRVYWTNYSLLKGGAEEGATYLQGFIKENDINNAVLVGISYGSISAFHYLQRMDGWDRVSKFIRVAGPFKGTSLAYLLFFLKGGRQIFPNSAYLKNLMEPPIKNLDKILGISARYDELVPLSSSILPDVRNTIIDTVGHNVLHMFSTKAFAVIAEEADI